MAANGIVAHMGNNFSGVGSGFSDWIRQVPAIVWRRTLIALLCLWLVFSLAKLFWLLVPLPDIPEPSLAPPSNISFTQNIDNGGSAIDITSLKKLSVFGDADAVVVEEPVLETAPGIEENAVDTNLSLMLVGTTVSSSENLSSAMIDNRGQQRAYYIGEELDMNPRGIKLAKVMNDRVILDNRGAYERLWVFDESDRSTRSSNRSRNSARTSAAPANTAFVGRGGPATPEAVEEMLDATLPQEGQIAPDANQIKAISEVFRPQMHRENGEFIGFKVRPGRDRELFEAAGLQPNDVVVAVNSTRLNDIQGAMEVWRSLSQETNVTLEVLRDGYSQTVSIDLESQP